MKTSISKILLVGILAVSAAGLYCGWKLFWFLTDDAFIAFRYVSNSILGYGYVWNPPPFRPVEGYTSPLWVMLLDLIWRIFGWQPPEVVNYLSLGFSYLTILLVAWTVLRMKLNPETGRHRLVFLSLVLLGTLTNRTFLAWSSSGMETAMFNFFFLLWLLLPFWEREESKTWLLAWSSTAALTYLSRPDGFLAILFTLPFILHRFRGLVREKLLSPSWFLSAVPLLIFVLHIAWRRHFYREWLPNTYYAKVVAPWPEAGVRYLLSFVLEYGLPIWILLAVYWLLSRFRTGWLNRPAGRKPARRGKLNERAAYLSDPRKLALSALLLHLAYYTLIVGGDHFEYRVYSHLIPLLFLSFFGMLNAINFKPARATLFLGLFVLFSWPVPWTHWMLTKNLARRDQAYILIAPISGPFPAFMRWYGGWFDRLQGWLITHHVCMRHQEHKVFYEYFRDQCPSRREGEKIRLSGYPVMPCWSVGVPGWVFPHVVILDEYGLNDYVIARSPYRRSQEKRLMAHDRFPPPGYVESWAPNLRVVSPKQLEIKKRTQELTKDYIVANEAYWVNQVSR